MKYTTRRNRNNDQTLTREIISKTRKSWRENSKETQQFPGNRRLVYNDKTDKMEDISPEESLDILEHINESFSKRYSVLETVDSILDILNKFKMDYDFANRDAKKKQLGSAIGINIFSNSDTIEQSVKELKDKIESLENSKADKDIIDGVRAIYNQIPDEYLD